RLRVIDLGGEPLYRHDVEMFQRSFPPPCTLANHLAFTEASVSAMCFIDQETKNEGPGVPVGRPSDGMNIFLLDDRGLPLEGDGAGEIAVASPFLSPGYWGQPELTEAAFPQLPCSDGTQRRVYRSGDLGRW